MKCWDFFRSSDLLSKANNVNSEDLENKVRAICTSLQKINDNQPEMSGMDWANEHGWVTQEEWEIAEEKAKEGSLILSQEAGKIDDLRKQYPQEMDAFFSRLLNRLERIRLSFEKLAQESKTKNLKFEMNFNLILLPEIIAGISAARHGEKPVHGAAWTWRVAFSVIDESEAWLARQ